MSLKEAHEKLRETFKKTIRMKAEAEGFLIRKTPVVTNDGKEVFTFVLQEAHLEPKKNISDLDLQVIKSVKQSRCVATGSMIPVINKLMIGDYLLVKGFFHDDPMFIDDEPEGIIMAEAVVKKSKNDK